MGGVELLSVGERGRGKCISLCVKFKTSRMPPSGIFWWGLFLLLFLLFLLLFLLFILLCRVGMSIVIDFGKIERTYHLPSQGG